MARELYEWTNEWRGKQLRIYRALAVSGTVRHHHLRRWTQLSHKPIEVISDPIIWLLIGPLGHGLHWSVSLPDEWQWFHCGLCTIQAPGVSYFHSCAIPFSSFTKALQNVELRAWEFISMISSSYLVFNYEILQTLHSGIFFEVRIVLIASVWTVHNTNHEDQDIVTKTFCI